MHEAKVAGYYVICCINLQATPSRKGGEAGKRWPHCSLAADTRLKLLTPTAPFTAPWRKATRPSTPLLEDAKKVDKKVVKILRFYHDRTQNSSCSYEIPCALPGTRLHATATRVIIMEFPLLYDRIVAFPHSTMRRGSHTYFVKLVNNMNIPSLLPRTKRCTLPPGLVLLFLAHKSEPTAHFMRLLIQELKTPTSALGE